MKKAGSGLIKAGATSGKAHWNVPKPTKEETSKEELKTPEVGTGHRKSAKMNRLDVGLTILNAQPLHNGHCEVIDTMLETCGVGIVLLSTGGERTRQYPLSYEERELMIKHCYPDEYECSLFVAPYEERKLENDSMWFHRVWGKCITILSSCPTHYFSARNEDLDRRIGEQMVKINCQDTMVRSQNIRSGALKGDFSLANKHMHPMNAQMFKMIIEGVSL